GPGGIGKTTVALAIAREIADVFADGVCFVDLGRIVSEDQVYLEAAGALDFPVEGEPTLEQVLIALQGRRLLLILDSFEHVSEKVGVGGGGCPNPPKCFWDVGDTPRVFEDGRGALLAPGPPETASAVSSRDRRKYP